jgi:hypothetical protein
MPPADADYFHRLMPIRHFQPLSLFRFSPQLIRCRCFRYFINILRCHAAFDITDRRHAADMPPVSPIDAMPLTLSPLAGLRFHFFAISPLRPSHFSPGRPSFRIHCRADTPLRHYLRFSPVIDMPARCATAPALCRLSALRQSPMFFASFSCHAIAIFDISRCHF